MPFYEPDVVAEAKKLDLLTYLQNYEPQELVHVSGNVYCTKTHDSLRISNGKWCWFSQGIGGKSALDYLIKVNGYSFLEAMERIVGQAAAKPPVVASSEVKEKPKTLLLPEKYRYAEYAASVTFKFTDQEAALKEIKAKLSFPLFVKPVRAGSSFGITKVTENQELEAAIQLAFEHDTEVIVEEAIDGFEVGCAILGNDVLTVGRVDEIELSSGFFDYTEKYTLKTSQIHMPARIDATTEKKIQDTALRIYKALGCSGFARVDLFLFT